MHDKFGREIHEGDIVIGRSWIHGKNKPLLVVGCVAGSETCNLNCTPVHTPTAQISSFNARDTVLAVKADGTIVPEPGGEHAQF